MEVGLRREDGVGGAVGVLGVVGVLGAMRTWLSTALAGLLGRPPGFQCCRVLSIMCVFMMTKLIPTSVGERHLWNASKEMCS